MAVSPDPMTRSTRRAANAAAISVVLYAVLWVLATLVDEIRAAAPVAEDPWDAVATYAAIFLPVVAGATWVRSVRHRSAVLPSMTASRIRWGAGLAAAIVLLAAVVDAHGIVTNGFPADAGPAGGVIAGLVAMTVASSAIAVGLVVRAARLAPSGSRSGVEAEPDIIEDLLALAADAGRPVGLDDRVRRIGNALDATLDRSAWSPRRHRLGFGLVVATLSGVASAGWHVLREGPPPSAGVLVVFAVLMGSGVLAVYVGTVGPLRLLRPPGP
jgi:hypothetical protein